MKVIRPQNPALAVATALEINRAQKAGEITQAESSKRFWDMLSIQTYTFVGYHGNGTDITDADGKVIDQLKPGDSFVESD